MEPVVFRSKVDVWLGVILIGAAVITVGAVLAVALGGSILSGLVIAPVLIFTAILPLWLLKSTYYVLNDTQLTIHSGPFEWRVRLENIQAITRTRNPLSSPALSLDRLRIDYGPRKSIMISPLDREGFLTELEIQRQNLKREQALTMVPRA